MGPNGEAVEIETEDFPHDSSREGVLECSSLSLSDTTCSSHLTIFQVISQVTVFDNNGVGRKQGGMGLEGERGKRQSSGCGGSVDNISKAKEKYLDNFHSCKRVYLF